MYRTIDAALWTDPKVRSLSPDAKLLFVYLITNPHSHLSGMYYLPRALMAQECSLSSRALISARDTLSRSELCQFDDGLDIVWVCGMMKYQARGEKARKSTAHHIREDLHGSALIPLFLAKYPEIKDELSPDEVQRFSIGHPIGYPEKSDGATPDSRSLIPESRFLNPEQEHRKQLCAFLESSFDRLWEMYPNAKGKKDARRHFDATVKTREDVTACETALKNYIETRNFDNARRKEFGRDPIPWQNGSTWFNQWQDWIPKAELKLVHSEHTCEFCAEVHRWPCEMESCNLGPVAACKAFIEKRREAHA
jgi:hypothetical protein